MSHELMDQETLNVLLNSKIKKLNCSQEMDRLTVRHQKKGLTVINRVSGVSSLAWREAGDTCLNHTRLGQLR